MAPTPKKQLKLGGFFHPTGNHVASWLHPNSQLDAGINFQHYAEIAQTAERGKFDLIFLRDNATTRDGNMEALKRWPQYMCYFEPTTLLSALAPLTKHIGLVATATASHNEPYNIARRFASLDHITGGRAGWNVVASSDRSENLNFGVKQPVSEADRYSRAREFMEVCRGLWDSWDDDAFLRDRKTATYFDPTKLHRLDFEGKHFSVRGPLNQARPPQGYPVIANAGVSNTGKDFAAQYAEIMFTPLNTIEQAKALYSDLKGRMGKFGRDPAHLKLMPGLNVIVAKTESEAKEKHEYLQSLIHPDVGRQLLSTEFGFDLLPYPVDEPPPYHLIDEKGSAQRAKLVEWTKSRNMTIREIYLWYAGGRGQRSLIGTPQSIADDMQHWLESEAVDGFLIQPPWLPGGLNEFVDMVVPELQRRGLFRTEYEGRTLRENLGLPRPPSRYSKDISNAAE
jgi:N-acetyl-S-(2-succino)cysteine monooxygenase